MCYSSGPRGAAAESQGVLGGPGGGGRRRDTQAPQEGQEGRAAGGHPGHQEAGARLTRAAAVVERQEHHLRKYPIPVYLQCADSDAMLVLKALTACARDG